MGVRFWALSYIYIHIHVCVCIYRPCLVPATCLDRLITLIMYMGAVQLIKLLTVQLSRFSWLSPSSHVQILPSTPCSEEKKSIYRFINAGFRSLFLPASQRRPMTFSRQPSSKK